MHGYEDDLDEEAGYEDYYSEDEGLEDEYEDEEEEEERQPPKEELEYLALRQKLKDSLRKKLGNGSASAQSSQDRRRKLPYNDFGSFFGPSRPVISSRVIQESKSLLENEIRTARMPASNQTEQKKRPVPASGSGTKNVSHEKRNKVVNEVRRKVATLKDARDYSFLLSDDADLPVPKKESLPPRNGSLHNSEARPSQSSARPKQSSGINGRPLAREEKRPVSANGHSRPEEKRPVSANGHSRPATSGSHSRPAGSSGSQLQNSRPSSSGSQLHSRPISGRPASSGSQLNSRPVSSGSQRPASSGSQRPGSSTNREAPMRPPGSTTNSQSSINRNSQPSSRLDCQRSAPGKAPLDHHRKQMSSSNGVGPGRSSSSTARPLPSKNPLERRPSISAGKTPLQSSQRPSSSRPMSSDPRQRLEQRKVSRDPATSRMIPKQSVPMSKHQMSRPGMKRPPGRDIDDDRRPKKKKPARVSEDDEALSMIRQMFKTDRFAGRCDDDRNMEANFDDIQKEERRSARIAREEDEREALLLEEEERRERLRKEKNRKLR